MVAELFVNDKIRNILQVNNDKRRMIPDSIFVRFYKYGTVMVTRMILPEAKQALTQFRALCITGPRQSGKTTLSKQLFKGKPYVNFENPTVQHEAELNPEAFLKKYRGGAVFDEV